MRCCCSFDSSTRTNEFILVLGFRVQGYGDSIEILSAVCRLGDGGNGKENENCHVNQGQLAHLKRLRPEGFRVITRKVRYRALGWVRCLSD